MIKKIKFFAVLLIILFIVILISYIGAINSPLDKNSQEAINFSVLSGQGVKQISKNLKEAKIIDSAFFFNTYVKRKHLQDKLQAGDYVLSPALTIKEIVEILKIGNTQNKERSITIIEGKTSSEIAKYFEEQNMFSSEEVLELVGFPKIDYRYEENLPQPKDYSSEFDLLKDKPVYVGLEGYLFPDTYRIYIDADLDDIIRKMLGNFDGKLTAKMREDISKQGKTIYEIVTMASLIEKEVRTEKDMKIVSGIFWNRIKNGQALQSCASLAYILGVNKAQYTTEDTKIISPYNTYQNPGLPPGPISNPGIQAIKAAIYPTDTDYNYFLTNPANGETIFSKTFNEHIKNKNKYLN